MKSAQRDGVVEVVPSASSDKVTLVQEVNKQPEKAISQCPGYQQSSWRLVISYHTRNRYLAGGRVKPSSRKVNHRFPKRTACPPTRGQDNALRNDPVFPSSRKEKSKNNAKIGQKQARFRVMLLPAQVTVEPLALVAHAEDKIPLSVNVLPVPPAATKHPAVVVPADRGNTMAASLTLPAFPGSPCESQVLHETSRTFLPLQNCCLPAPLVATTTSSQGGKVPFVSLWRLVYGMLFAMLLQLDLCGAAAVVAGATPSPPPPRHTLWKDGSGAGAVAKDVPAASPVHPAEQPRLRGPKEVNSALSSHHAALSNFQHASANSTSYSWQLTSAPAGSYEAIACSENGQHVVAGNYHGYLYTSNDYGATWNQSLSVLGYYLDIASSRDGRYWFAVSFSVGIYTSNDYGHSWNLTSAAPIGWYSIASSANGQYLSAATNSESIYTSNDYGHTWHVTSAGMANWRALDSSDSGHFLAAVAWNDGVYTSSDYGVSWTKSNYFFFTMNIFMVHAVTVSRTGQYLAVLAGGMLLTSSDYGYTWIDSNPSEFMNWQYFTASGSGHYLAGNNYDFHVSVDYGVTWVSQSVPPFSLVGATLSGDGFTGYGYDSGSIYRMTRHNDSIPSVEPPGPHEWQVTSAPSALYRSIASSESGQYVVAGAYTGYLYTSNDFGVTWNMSLATLGYYIGVTSSRDGQYWAATSDYTGVYTSNDYGHSWSLTSAPPSEWRSIASSYNGQYIFAVPTYGSIYASNDYGQTWYILKEAIVHWVSIKSSASGQHLAAVSTSYGLYLSSDYGVTWNISFTASTPYWYAVTISSSGQHVAAIGDGNLYTSSDYGVSWNTTSPLNMFLYILASSGSGQYIVGGYEGSVHDSVDYGVTWATSSVSNLLFLGAALSGNGQYAFGYKNGAIYRLMRHNTLIEPSALPTAQPSVMPTAATTAVSTNGQSVSPVPNTCLAGTYNMQPGQSTTVCAICPGGTYSTEGMTSCLSCPVGTFSTAWSSACTECPAGFYCLHGASTAVMCPSGTVSNAGASSCTACPVGQYSYAGTSTCLTCSSA